VQKKIIRKIASRFLPTIRGTSIFNRKDVEIHRLYEADTFEIPLIKDVFGDTHSSFKSYSCKIPASYVATITNGRCQIGKEEVFSSTNECFVEITSQKQNPTIGRFAPKNVTNLKGVIVNLSLSGLENNYYHFCVEWMARFHLLKKSLIHVDYYIISQEKLFQRQYMDILQIDKQKIITIEKGCYIEADYLVVPSMINNWESIKYREYQFYLKQWLPKWLGEIYKYCEVVKDDSKFTNHKNIYISRSLASYRKVKNEEEIINVLKKFDFSVYCLESMTVEQQIGLFRNAKFIVSAHGAGLINMSYCQSPATILEIYSEHYHDSGLRLQAFALGHKYEYFIGQTSNISNVHPRNEDIYIDASKLERAIQIITEKYNL
jgi:capsular polysaccharide biosynthesis protein